MERTRIVRTARIFHTGQRLFLQPPREKAVFNWSGGKDSALALYKAQQSEAYEIVSLLTTVNRDNARSSMHGIPVGLLRRQADSIGLPLYTIDLAPDGTMENYEEAMAAAVGHFRDTGADRFIFGDIFLHDVRSYREKQLSPYGITVVEPLWGKSSAEIMREFLASGLQTVIVTTTADRLGRDFIGRRIDETFVRDLPDGVDVCGENGEYHTFCYAGGPFRTPVQFALGEPLQRRYPVKLDDGTVKNYAYWFADIREG